MPENTLAIAPAMLHRPAAFSWEDRSAAPVTAGSLALARRLDWRFLLPNPKLKRVAYVGEGRGDLLPALREFSDSLRTDACAVENADLLVAQTRNLAELKRQAERLPPGGLLYWEAGGRHMSLSRVRAELRALGFGEVRAYWHHPDFESCRQVVPLHDPEAMELFVTRSAPALLSPAQRLLRLPALLNLVARLAPAVSVVAVKQGGRSLESFLPAVLRRNWARWALNGLAAPRKLSFVLCTPRFRTSRNVIFLIRTSAKAAPALVAKVARLAPAGDLLVREAGNLRRVQAAVPQRLNSIPRLMACETLAGHSVLLQTAVAGRVLAPHVLRRASPACLDGVVDWLIQVHRSTAQTVDKKDRWFHRVVRRPLEQFAQSFSAAAEERSLVNETLRRAQSLFFYSFPSVFEHGDLSSPNLLLADDGQIGVVDWELAEPCGLPAADLFFFLNYVAFARSKASNHAEHVAAFQEAFFGRNAWSLPYVSRYRQALNLPPETLRDLFLLCWARYVARLPIRAGQHETIDGTTEPSWLGQNRYCAMWRHALRSADALHFDA